MCGLLAFLGTLLVSSSFADIDSDYNSLNFSQIVARNGYPVEEHRVITEDGFILTTFRMSSGNCTEPKGTPVLFMHGFLESSDALLDAGPGVAIPYLLADDCFDLWVGNSRGNMYGRAHISLNPDTDKEFWAFSLDEMGIYDLPAIIDYILNTTSSETINYLGYSQGGGEVIVTCSEKPQYNDKISLIIALAPAARPLNTSSPLLRLLLVVIYYLKDVLSTLGIHELFKKGGLIQSSLNSICEKNTTYDFCDEALNLIDPYNPRAKTQDTIRRVYAHFPSGVSVQHVSRYAQGLTSEYFQKYDYGSETENLAIYNSTTPPIYNVSKVIAPTVLTYSETDHIISEIDTEWLKDQLPNVLEFRNVDGPKWTHLDNIYNNNLTTLVYPTIKKYLTEYTVVTST